MQPNYIYTGFWTNWSRGPVFGSTLTLSQAEANILITFLSFFVTLVGTQLWGVARLILHMKYSSKQSKDALHQQRQAVLRNSSDPFDGSISLLRIAWAWRGSAQRPWRRLVPPIFFGLFWFLSWAFASIFSAQLSTSMGSEVLISSPNCGFISQAMNDNATGLMTQFVPYISKKSQSSSTYAQECYDADTSGSLECGTYVKKSIPSHVNTTASCPFASSMCAVENENLLLDTGYMDTLDHFGLNMPSNIRLQYRLVTHCAPLVTEGFVTHVNLSSDLSYSQFWYGPQSIDPLASNWTAMFSNDFIEISKATHGSDAFPEYSISEYTAQPYNGSIDANSSTFIPIPELQRTDADTYLFLLSPNGIVYSEVTTDPWFNASQQVGTMEMADSDGSSVAVYYPSEPASALGCAMQQQICNPSLPDEDERCTPLGSSSDVFDNAAGLFDSSEPLYDFFYWILDVINSGDSDIGNLVYTMGGGLLLATNSLQDGLQAPLPDNQWQLEVQHWQNTSLARLQSIFVDMAQGSTDASVVPWLVRPTTTMERTICQSQKITSTAYSSFSVFGLLFVLIFGLVAIVASCCVEPILYYLHRRLGRHRYSYLEWCMNQTLQLQRLAHEEVGAGTWRCAADFVPLTKPGEELAIVDFTDPAHPRLSVPLDLTEVDSLQGDDDVGNGAD